MPKKQKAPSRWVRSRRLLSRRVSLALIVIAVLAVAVVAPDLRIHGFADNGNDLKPRVSSEADPVDPDLKNPVISRGVPAYASAGGAAAANDDSYDSVWSTGPGASWLAYDLSKVPAKYRDGLLLVWYNEATSAYDQSISLNKKASLSIPRSYVIETNDAAGGGKPPQAGWSVRTTVRNNPYHSRQHVIEEKDANWVRLRVAGSQATQVRMNMDVYPLEAGLADNWIFYGSSTPSRAMNHLRLTPEAKTFSQMIAQARPGRFPVQENGSIGGINSEDGVKHIDTWLSIFPGKYVYLGLGANDAAECVPPAIFYRNMETMVIKAVNAGKVPVVPMFNWSPSGTVQHCGPPLINEIERLYVAYPQIVRGQDFWTYFRNNSGLVSADNIHPTLKGMWDYRRLSAQSALQTVYSDNTDKSDNN